MIRKKLAINGGKPAFETNDFRRSHSDEVRDALMTSFTTGQWSDYHGDAERELIGHLKTQFERSHVRLCSSGTIAVELALRGVGVRSGDEVILSGYDFPGNFRAIEAIGATPVLVDVIENGWTIDPKYLRDAVSDKTKAILVSHLHGNIAPLPQIEDELNSIAGGRVAIIEDACQAPGGFLNGKPLGSFGTVSTFSFGGSKILTAGRGGAILSNDDSVIQRMKVFSERGNESFPLSQLQACVLSPQVLKLTDFSIERREQARKWFSILDQAFEGTEHWNKTGGQETPDSIHAYYKLPILLASGAGLDRDELVATIAAENVPVGIGFRGFVNRSARRCRKPVPLDNCRVAVNQTILLAHPILDLDDQQMAKLADVILASYRSLSE